MGRSNHTDSYYRIFKQQAAWAKRKRLSLDAFSHVPTLEANLFAPLHPTTRAEYEMADGKELESKLFSVMSSAALVCNVFDYWRLKGRAETIAKCCGIPDSVMQLCFEPAFEIFDGKKPARPDAALIDGPCLRDAQVLTAVEAKFAEPYRRSNLSDREPFSETYFKPCASPKLCPCVKSTQFQASGDHEKAKGRNRKRGLSSLTVLTGARQRMPTNYFADERGSFLKINWSCCLVLDVADNRATLPTSTNAAVTSRQKVIGDGSADRVDSRSTL